jgi:hypothetical protein
MGQAGATRTGITRQAPVAPQGASVRWRGGSTPPPGSPINSRLNRH